MLLLFVTMIFKNQFLSFLLLIGLPIILFFVSINNVFAAPSITSFLLNNSAQNVTFNPNNDESISIEVKANTQVKFTRLYICSINQICNGTSGNYTRYFSQSDISDTITKSWNGKKSGDVEIVPAGEYRVMVSMTEGSNAAVTEFGPYSIFINFSNTESTTTNSTSSDSQSDEPTSTTTNSSTIITKPIVVIRTVYVSAHSGTEDLSDYDEKIAFKIVAGRERITLSDTPIEFNAKYTLLQKDSCVPTFKWSFGDGFEAIGKNITHTYRYPGEYQVILNSDCGEYKSTSRTVVKVISPNVFIQNDLNGDIEIFNNGMVEINIGSWKIKGGQNDFIFPQDTIISAKNKIVISSGYIGTNASTSSISLNNPTDREVAHTKVINEQKDPSIFSRDEIIKNIVLASSSDMSVAEAEKLAIEYKQKIALTEQKNNMTESLKETNTVVNVDNNILNNEGIIQIASVMNAVISTSTSNFWANLIDIPIKSIKSLIHIFYDF